MDGLVSINKPPGVSSHDVISWARKKLNLRKIGHAGTLDPGAAGVLVLGVGKGTRVIGYIQNAKKRYRAEITLGIETTSGDNFTEAVLSKEVSKLTEKDWKSVFSSFIGQQKQLPPMTSALKKEGVPLYKLARAGIEVAREPRDIVIYDLELVNVYNNKVLFDVVCSKGTYIRVLCQDIARAANNLGTMSFLLRTEVGMFNLDNSSTMSEEVEILPLNLAVNHLPKIVLNEAQVEYVKHGRFIELKYDDINDIALLNNNGKLIAIAKVSNNQLIPKKVFTQ